MDDDYDKGDRAQLFIAEGDTCFRQKLFDKAIEAYTLSLELAVDRNVLLNRSKCFVAIGKTEQAIEDAERAIDEAGTDFYVGFYEKGEAYFAAGEFEDAIACYYRAYQKRPDVKEFKLGVEKAEEAILKAVSSSIPYDFLSPPDELDALTNVADLQALISSPPIGKREANRCICGCYNCIFSCCRDAYFPAAKNEPCWCRCSACIEHLAQKHGIISEPLTGNPVKSTELLQGDQTSVSTTATPGTAHDRQKGTPTEQSRYTPVKRHRLVTKAPMQEDLELLQDLKNDQVLGRVCGSIQSDIKKGISFISNRNEFWREQGGNKGLNKKSRTAQEEYRVDTSAKQSRTAHWAAPTVSAIEELEKYPVQLNKIRHLMDEGLYDEAIVQLEEMEIELQAHRNEIASRISNDVEILLGCCHFEEKRYSDALIQFERAHTLSLEIKDDVAIIRAYRCIIAAETELQEYNAIIQHASECLNLINERHQDWKYLWSLVKFALCFAESEIGQRIPAVEDLFELLEVLQGSSKPTSEIKCKVSQDSGDYFANAFVMLTESDPTPEEVLEDSLCLAGMLDVNLKGVEYLESLVRYSESCNDMEAKKAGLENLAYLYKERGQVEEMEEVMARIAAVK